MKLPQGDISIPDKRNINAINHFVCITLTVMKTKGAIDLDGHSFLYSDLVADKIK